MTPEEWKELEDRVAAMERRRQGKANAIPSYKDPTCPKCGIVLGNRMAYACGEFHCPVGLN